jgi:hypothetical protein
MIALTFRGVPVWLLQAYLRDLGGHDDGEAMVGPGWRITFTARKVRVGSLTLGEVVVRLDGDESVIGPLADVVRAKAMRGGG